MRRVLLGGCLSVLCLLLACGGGGGSEPAGETGPDEIGIGTSELAFDFQPGGGRLLRGFEEVTPDDAYASDVGYGFTSPPNGAVSGARHAWTIFGKTYTVADVIPASVLSDATVDCVTTADSGGRPLAEDDADTFAFRADVDPGDYTVTLWLGDVTTPTYQVRATVNGVVVDVERMDVCNRRGNLDQNVFGHAVPRVVRVRAPDGVIDVEIGPHPDGPSPITWTYEQDEDPKNPPTTKTATLVPAFTAAGLQALTVLPAADPPLVQEGGRLVAGSATSSPALDAALASFNAGDVVGARAAFAALADPVTSAAGLFWVAGHPALVDEEPALLAEAAALLETEAPRHRAAADLLLQVQLAEDAERYRRLYGYAAAGAPATDNLGRSCALVENFPPDHPYHLKGQILWLRNRGGLDPRRVTVSWERAQWLARGLEPAWGGVNPYVHLYATDEWANLGNPWSVIDWASVAGTGPDWARALMSNMNGWLDLFEWWAIHRQSPEGDIGGGWTDDVEVVPAFGLMAYVLEGASDISRDSVVRFADGIWNSTTIDPDRGYQAQYGDVEHTAEPTGNILHLYPLVRFGDPEGLERIMKSAKTWRDLFLTTTPTGHTHFKGNYLSATQIATNPNHRADIPLCGRATNPFPFLAWYSGNPGIETPLEAWIGSWVADAARTEHRKPAGVFPQVVWTPTDDIGYPGTTDWWSKNTTYGQFGEFPKYQYYLYNLAAWYWLRTGEARFREPLDRLQEYTLGWAAAGRPPAGAAPPVGEEEDWCGSKLQTIAQGAMTNAAIASGLSDWDSYIGRFGDSYGRFLLDPTDATSIDDLSALSDELYEKWPYRTTEGVMTDRLLVVGWAEVISYYIGAEVFSVFFGMPVHAVTWQDTTRLFAAAVTEATPTEIDASVYLFTDQGRDVTMRLWQLELGASYVLEAGPASGLGLDPGSVAESVAFDYDHLGDTVTFTLPGRQTYAVRIRQTDPPSAAPGLLPDPAVAARDVTFDSRSGELSVRVHNVGAAEATSVQVDVYEGIGAGGALIGSDSIASIDAPLDLVPRSVTVQIAYAPPTPPLPVTVVLSLGGGTQITDENDVAVAWIGGGAPDLPPPMLVGLDPVTVPAGGQVALAGRGFQVDVVPLLSDATTPLLTIDRRDAQSATLHVGAALPAGIHLISVRNPDGQKSNLLPLTVTN